MYAELIGDYEKWVIKNSHDNKMNNFATTESEIMGLATMLVGTLSSIGVGEDEILGLSAAMSALGITAERGGSTMSKFFSEMASAVANGGEDLYAFAELAGTSADEFINAFNRSPMEGLDLFLSGMRRAKENGQSFVETLDKMGIKEVRLRDTLLRLAGGHDVLTDALKQSSNAYGEATALQSEYDLMMSSTSAQWDVAKNRMRDVAIEVGSHLLPVLLDLLGESDGLINMAKGLADWFGNLDDSIKRNIVLFGGLALPIGLTVSAIGNLITAGGQLLSFFGGAIMAIPKLLAHFKTFDSITGETTKTFGKFSSTGLKAIAGFASAHPILTGVSLAVGGVALAYRLLTKDAREAARIVREFPKIENLAPDQADSLRSVIDDVTELKTALETLNTGVDVDTISKSTGKLADEIERLNSKKIEEAMEAFERLPTVMQDSMRTSIENYVSGLQDQIDHAKEAVKMINRIAIEGQDENGVLSDGYKRVIKNLTDDVMSIYANALGESVEQQRQIYETLTADVTEMTSEQLETRLDYLNQSVRKEADLYKDQQKLIEDMRRSGSLSEKEYLDESYRLKQANASRVEALFEEEIRTRAEMWKEHHGLEGEMNEEQLALYKEHLQAIADEYGKTLEEVEDIINSADMTKPIRNLVGYAQDASVDLKMVAGEWEMAMADFSMSVGKNIEDITFDDVIKNADEFADAIHNAGLTWKDLEFLKKEGIIDDNTAEFLERVTDSDTLWNAMTFEEKLAYLEVDPEGIEQLKEITQRLNIDWNEFEAKVIELKADGNTAHDSIRMAIDQLTDWNTVPIEEKQMYVDASIANEEIRRALQASDAWNDNEFLSKYMEVLTNAEDAEADVSALIQEWTGISSESKTLHTETNADETQGILDNLLGFWLVNLIGGIFGGADLNTRTNAPETQSELESAKSAQESLDGTTSEITTSSNASDTESDLVALSNQADSTGSKKPDIHTSTNASATEAELASAESQAVSLDGQSPNIPVTATDGFSGTFASAWREHNSIDGYSSNSYHYTHFRTTGTRYLKTGTNYHTGGLAVLGDGGKREPFMTPQGAFGVSPNKDTLYDLPTGSKVWPSINKFKQDAYNNSFLKRFIDRLPKFATGTDKSFLDDLNKFQAPKNMMDNHQVTSNNTINLSIDLQVIGSSITRSQADGIIEPLMESAERFSRRTGRELKIT